VTSSWFFLSTHNLFCVCVFVCELSLRPKTSHQTRKLRDCSVAQADSVRRESTAEARSNLHWIFRYFSHRMAKMCG